MEKGKLIIIMGPSGKGKTMLADAVIGSEHLGEDENEVVETGKENSILYAPKYVTRDLKDGDTNVIQCSSDEIEKLCDVIIPGYRDGDLIGFNVSEIFKQIDEGKTLVIATGFMKALQEILKKFIDEDRLNDIFMVGMNTFDKDKSNISKLTEDANSDDEDISDDASKRLEQSAIFVKQFKEFKPMFDFIVTNYDARYENLSGEGAIVCLHAQRSLDRDDDEQIETINNFITCDLSEYTIDPAKEM